MSNEPEFGKWRGFLWPIHGYEMKKFLPLFIMFLLITFNYTFLRNTKDTLVLNTGGPDMLSALKLYVVLPSAILYTSYYGYIANKCDKESVFYYAIMPFVAFFALFLFVLYPMQEALECVSFYNYFKNSMSPGAFQSFSSIINVVRYWPFSLFYLMSELWGSAVLSLLFWSFTNGITDIKQAKRFYALLGIGANVGLAITGPFTKFLSAVGDKNFDFIMNGLMITFLFTTAIIIAIYYWMNRNVLNDPLLVDPNMQPKKKKAKASFFEAIGILFSSRHLMFIAVLVIAYGISINLVEVVWKSQVKMYFAGLGLTASESKASMQEFFANTNTATGILSILLMLFVSGQVERALGWTVAALITPVVILLLGLVFFGISFALNANSIPAGLSALCNPLLFTIVVGSAQNVFSKAAKYSLFDPTKEKAYFPLDYDGRTKGKSAVDVIAARFGKGGGAAIQQAIIIGIGPIVSCLPLLALIVFAVIAAWIISGTALGRSLKVYERSLEEKEAQEAQAADSSAAS